MVRHKNRYIVVEIKGDARERSEGFTVKNVSLQRCIIAAVQKLHGDYGVAALTAGFTAKYCNEKTGVAIIRCRHGPHKLVYSSIPFIKSIDGKLCHCNSLYCGATIRQCFKYIQRYQQRKFDEYCLSLTDEVQRNSLWKEIMNLEILKDMQ